ncbi:Ankyrin repeat protein [Giardia duodenalis]|uniref:Ankyrin repeat protein n=2 Tax=Giardia intestinalis TaxID=5741 RepID=V6U7W9_GIAIN|nr:Ankyrin repeat protein [Giardia intestinalis]
MNGSEKETSGKIVKRNKMHTEYTPHGYLLGKLVKQHHALDIYEAIRTHDNHPVCINRIKRDELKTMELVDMELSIRHLPFVINPYITKCFSVQRHNGSSSSYVITDRPSTETLVNLIASARSQGEHLSEAKIWYIFAQLLYALASIHDPIENQRLKNDSPPVHMDIRPSSICVTRDGNYLLSVFSPNKFLCQPSTEPVSSYDYMLLNPKPSEDGQHEPQQAIYTAPEWFLTGEYTAASDIWSLGALLYELCTFKPLFVVPSSMDKRDTAALLQSIAAERRPIPQEYTDILRCTIYYMLNINPSNRPLLSDLFEMRQVVDMLYMMNKTPPETFLSMPSPSSNPFISRMKTIERLCDTPETRMSPDVLMDIMDLATPSSFLVANYEPKSANTATCKLRNRSDNFEEAQAPDDNQLPIPTAPSNPLKLTLPEAGVQGATPPKGPTPIIKDASASSKANPYDDKTLSISELNPDKANSLILAVEVKDVEKIMQLIPTHAGRATLDGRTALMVAAEQEMIDVVRLLAPKEAKMALKAPRIFEGETALMQVARRGLISAVTALAPYEAKCVRRDGQTALMIAAQAQKKNVVDVLIHFEHGLTDEDGWTALKIASNFGYLDIVESLVSFEAGIADDTGETALMVAANKGFLDIVKSLQPAEIKMQTTEGQTALMCAVHKGHASICELLAPEEAKLKKVDGTTALMCAAYANSLECVRLLLHMEEGMQTNSLYPKGAGYTALLLAIEQRAYSAAEYILANSPLERKKSVVLSSDGSKTWIELAKELGSPEALTLIANYSSEQTV